MEFEIAGECGKRNVDGIGRYAYVKQSEAQFGEFPWMMAVLRKYKVGPSVLKIYIAGGSLIHPSVVLTTAHNLNNTISKFLTVRGGEWNTQSRDEMFEHVERNVKEVTYHNKFTRHNLHNDLALLFLTEPFEMTPHINTVCMPLNEYHSEGVNCYASGWGKEQFGKNNTYQVFLKKVEMPTVSSSNCEQMLKQTRLGEDFILHKGFMCAGNNQKNTSNLNDEFDSNMSNDLFLGGQKDIDTCTGDGGSPLVCPIPESPDHFYQAGIVSWGISCNLQNVPGVYVDVFKYMPWIEEQFKRMNYKLFK